MEFILTPRLNDPILHVVTKAAYLSYRKFIKVEILGKRSPQQELPLHFPFCSAASDLRSGRDETRKAGITKEV
tara:strand:+ start:125 stop:343 length:219 start_codon:yes stop_codon:yes gene_type:complete